MATSRKRGERWEFCVRRKPLKKPIWISFATYEEGEAWCARVEKLLESGIVPDELAGRAQPLTTISIAHDRYAQSDPVSATDQSYWPVILKRWGLTRIATVDYAWVEAQVERCKNEWQLAPSTTRHMIGTMARLWDWLLKRQAVATNPFRLLRHGYASGARKDVERDRRLTREEEVRLIAVLDGDMLRLFLLALETAMRLREMFTLTADQVDLARKTIFLDKTKNGDKRQVPLSSVALDLLRSIPAGAVFPTLWRDGDTPRVVTNRLSIRFARAAEIAGCADLHFHDLRHEATCRLYERTTLSDLQIAKITGHRDLKMLRRYANLRGSDLADRLW